VRQYLERAFLQGERLNELVLSVQKQKAKSRQDKDRILHFLQDSFTFLAGENTVQNLVFNLPFADDFEAARLYLWPSTRLVKRNQTSFTAESELVFRPTFWTGQASATPLGNQLLTSAVDALVEMSVSFPDGKTRSYQNTAWPASQAFSFSTLSDNSFGIFDRTNAAGALAFDPCLVLSRGTSVTLRITPLFSAEYLDPVQGDQGLEPGPLAEVYAREYKITGVLEGYKRQ